jgi:tRNA-2-methylthio-N6-dimethylallyladenosine synthase
MSFQEYLNRQMPKPSVEYPNVGEPNEKYLKKAYIQTWGCQMNVADSERMLSLLGSLNYRPTETEGDADLILLNTCHIREKARHKVLSRLGELRELKKTNPDLILAVSGCVAQADAQSLAKEAPYVDLIFGPDQIEELPKLLENKSADKIFTGFNSLGYSIPIDSVQPFFDESKNEVSKFVNIVKGCNNFCTFCVVPYTRGREKSRVQSEIIDEIKFYAQKGVKEISLLGQNVNSYGLDLQNTPQNEIQDDGLANQPSKKYAKLNPQQAGFLPFAKLLYAVSSIPEIKRIKFTTSNPHDFTPELAKAFADLPKVTNSFHLPVQSGSNIILDKMNRQYTREQYLERVGWIRAVRPNIAFSTDIIVGFPGETEEDFLDTLNLVKEMKYAFIYAFTYSERKGTPAVRFKEQVPLKIKDERLQTLISFQKQETEKQNVQEIGKTREVLVTYKNKKQENTWYGRTYEGRLVKVYSPRNLVGEFVHVEITNANLTALEGIPV